MNEEFLKIMIRTNAFLDDVPEEDAAVLKKYGLVLGEDLAGYLLIGHEDNLDMYEYRACQSNDGETLNCLQSGNNILVTRKIS
jgi:hypothetical protein